MISSIRCLSIGFLACSFSVGCAKQPPTLLDRLDEPQMTREELRARVYDYVRIFAGTVEDAAYGMVIGSEDIVIARDALVWVSSAVPAIQSAAFKTDPASGLVDVWALSLQQREFFEHSGRDYTFGEWHDSAVRASRDLVAYVEQIGRDLTSPADYERISGNIEAWAAEHPLESILFVRETTAPLTAAMLGSPGSGVFSSVGNMAEEVRDLSARVAIFAELVPKQARWQAALLLTAEAGGVSFQQLLREIGGYAAGISDITVFLDSVPELISTERAAVMNDVTAERMAVMRELRSLLDETLSTALGAVNQERVAVMDGVTEERVAALRDVDAIATRLADDAIDSAMLRVNDAIDYFYWRLIQVLAVLLVLLAIAGFVAIRIVTKRLATA
jgi:hypothetical protein